VDVVKNRWHLSFSMTTGLSVATTTGHSVLTAHAATLASLPLWVQVPALILTALLAAKLIDLVATRLVRRLVTHTSTELDEVVLEHLHVPVVVTIALAGVLLAEGVLPTDLQATVDPYVGKPTVSLIVLVWVFALNRLGNDLLGRAKDSDSAYASFAPVFSNLLTLAIVVGGLFMVLTVWSVDITPLLASAGIAGVAVGFAAKDTVANFFGGLALYFDRTYRVGDYVELESGDRGTVVKVGIRSTTLMTRDEVTVTVPNSVLNNARLVNHSAPKRRKRIRIDVSAAYGTDLDELEGIVDGVAADEALVLDSPRPRIRFLRFGDAGIEYQLRCWVPTPVRETKARHRLNRALYQRFEAAGIEIPYPRMDLVMRGDAPDAGQNRPTEAGADD
jgi:MscS family membrane protein